MNKLEQAYLDGFIKAANIMGPEAEALLKEFRAAQAAKAVNPLALMEMPKGGPWTKPGLPPGSAPGQFSESWLQKLKARTDPENIGQALGRGIGKTPFAGIAGKAVDKFNGMSPISKGAIGGAAGGTLASEIGKHMPSWLDGGNILKNPAAADAATKTMQAGNPNDTILNKLLSSKLGLGAAGLGLGVGGAAMYENYKNQHKPNPQPEALDQSPVPHPQLA